MKYLALFLLIFFSACKKHEELLFEKITSSSSGVDFVNKIEETEEANYFKYMYMYLGGGVATADFDKDGLDDLFFISNSHENKLYKNLGNFKFKDITQSTLIQKRKGFDVGAAVADINNDGWLDIYITRGGWLDVNGAFENMLYINNGITTLADGSKGVTFTERAKEYGLNDANRGVAATFLDYDRDGDLDVFISNTPDFEDRGNTVVDLNNVPTDPKTIALKGSDKLYQNEGNNHFKDISEQAGIKPDIGFGLSPQVGDLNNDGWLDIYVCNDFRIPDFVYINNGDGTFSDKRNEALKHMSFNSMGADIADINNDGLLDIYTLDMNPEDYVRARTTMGMTSQYQFELMVEKSHHRQYMHNMLQLNNGNGTFSEIANMAGVANTDWSWACLLADFNLDGLNDAFVTNGVFRDVIDRDVNDEILQTLQTRGRKPTDADFLEFTNKLPQQKLDNYLFKNNGDLTFRNVSQEWTETNPTFSNGALYSDLDNDGDLDIVVSNLNDEVTILKNRAIENELGNFVKIKLKGTNGNIGAIGATVKIKLTNGEILTRQLVTTRGFLSSVSPTLHFGLKKDSQIASLSIIWPNGRTQTIKSFEVNKTLELAYNEAETTPFTPSNIQETKLFNNEDFVFANEDEVFDDFKVQSMLPQKYSNLGPAMAVGDVNSDGIQDIYLGGSYNKPGKLLIGQKDGKYIPNTNLEFDKDKGAEDISATFFDADQDKDLDLIVASGSYEFENGSALNTHRLYLNDGKGVFTRDFEKLPMLNSIGGVVTCSDFDKDGDQDIFIGSRVVSGSYPLAPSHFLLLNMGDYFENYTAIAPELERFGMITDAVWNDIDNDKDIDLIVCGEWTNITVFENTANQFQISNSYAGLTSHSGWWNKILIEDVDGDGDKDIIAGNNGLNSKYKASKEFPLNIYGNDFDNNGIVDPVISTWYGDKEVPVQSRSGFILQMPVLGKKSTTFKEFANKNITELLGESIKNAIKLKATEFRSGIFLNNAKSDFEFKPFKAYAQMGLVNSILFIDIDNDGHKDLMLGGNNYGIETGTTRMDAGNGLILKGNGKGQFTYVPNYRHNFWTQNDVRNFQLITNSSKSSILVGNNNGYFQIFSKSKDYQ